MNRLKFSSFLSVFAPLRWKLFFAVFLFLLSRLSLMGGEVPVVLSTVPQLMAASRGEGVYATLPPGTTFLIKNGIYKTPPHLQAVIWVKKGGTPEAKRRFIGESRDGVMIHGRGTISADHVEFSEMTFDLRGFTPEEGRSFDTMTISGSKDVRIHHVTFTGDGSKGKMGGHIGVSYSADKRIPTDILIEDCLIEGFGRRSLPEGKLDHGVYLSEVNGAVIRNCEIRKNSGRGIQLYAHTDTPDLLTDIVIEKNLIHDNGVEAYTEGIVIGSVASRRTDVIGAVRISNNIIYHNAFSGIRLNASSCAGLIIRNNTFWHNSKRHARGAEIFIDTGSQAVPLRIEKNVFSTLKPALKADRTLKELTQKDNLVEGNPGRLTQAITGKKILSDPEHGDFSVVLPAYSSWGAEN